MIETKAASEINDPVVQAKRDAGVKWCEHATAYATQHGGKPWKYLLIPHDLVAENMTLAGLMNVA
jgi:type III restriction enzyme